MGDSAVFVLARRSLGEVAMNRIENKEMAADAARLFKQEVLELNPDIPRKELCDMVDNYIYYQTDGVGKYEAHAVVEATCLSPDRPSK